MIRCRHLLLFPALCLGVSAGPLPEQAWNSLAAHPRLFANAARWGQLDEQINTDPVSREIFTVVKKTAEHLLDQPPVEYVEKGAYWHGPMRQAQGRIMSLAMVFQLTGEAKFLTRAKLEMQTLADLPHWYPKHFLDTAEGALGMAVGLDWLHADLTAPERKRFEDALIEKALRPYLREETTKPWIALNNNWAPFCHGGLVIAALAVAEREPALAKQITDRALAYMPRYAELYAPAGAYSEGPDYWAYGTTFYVLLTEVLRMNFGTTCDLDRVPGFLQTADYTMQMTAPSGRLFNFADNGSSLGVEPVLFWFARELRRDALIARETKNLSQLADTLVKGSPRSDASRMLPLALLWRDPSMEGKPPPPPLVWWSQGGTQPQAVMRSAWNVPRATFVGIKGGRADDSHAHMDIGSFILEMSGVRWAVDLGRESYPHARANGIKSNELFVTTQDSKRWSIFRCGPESHNLLRFNNAPQSVDGTASISPADHGFSVDLTPAVSDQVIGASRQFTLNPDRSFTLRDTWKTSEKPAEVTWQWLTFANAQRSDHGFTLMQTGETLHLLATASSKVAYTIEDVSKPANKFDSANHGLSRLVINMQTPALTEGWLQVTASPPN